jgi:hypothetical protein
VRHAFLSVLNGYQYLAISGLLERQKMYVRMGFCPLGDAVRRGGAYFIPMLLDLSNLSDQAQRDLRRLRRRLGNSNDAR